LLPVFADKNFLERSKELVDQFFEKHLKEYQSGKAKEAALAAKKKKEKEEREKAEAAKKAAAQPTDGPTFEEVTDEEAAKIEAEEKAKKSGEVAVPTKKDEEEKGEDGKSKGAAPNAGNGG
jgi:hypothetical protein